jgi:hypothetical protein
MPNLPAKTSWCSIICFSNGEYTLGKYHFQKHLSQRMIGDTGTDWILQLRNAFLIRDPAEMIASYNVKRETVATEDLGLAQQVKLYRLIFPAPIQCCSGKRGHARRTVSGQRIGMILFSVRPGLSRIGQPNPGLISNNKLCCGIVLTPTRSCSEEDCVLK